MESSVAATRVKAQATTKVSVEVMSWLKEDFGYDGFGNLVLEETVNRETSVMDLTYLMASKYPKFGKKAFADPKQHLFDYCLVILNGNIISNPAELNKELKDGDTVKFTPAFSGG
jgi:molybdopterin converting factor small subunit